MMDASSFFARVFPTFVSCILVWADIDRSVLRFFLNEVIPMRCGSAIKRELCVNEVSEVMDMLTMATGFCLTFLVSSWLALDMWQRMFLSMLSVLSPALFVAYLHGPPSKYISFLHDKGLPALAERMPDTLAVIYIFLAGYITFYLSV